LGLGGGVGIVSIDAHQDGAARLAIKSGNQGGESKYQKRGAPQIRTK
jgi:hypothetical protein